MNYISFLEKTKTPTGWKNYNIKSKKRFMTLKSPKHNKEEDPQKLLDCKMRGKILNKYNPSHSNTLEVNPLCKGIYSMI